MSGWFGVNHLEAMSSLGQESNFIHPYIPALGMVLAHGGHFVNVYWINRQPVDIWFEGEERAW